ncbi:endo-1,4-beta-xylanase [Paenibacillus sp. JCM 10914]|uniref:endo-1,4-beta-xylanase n=1 Tax=Paenibacillus sp. JCM 10914 TaxID=1236974 RepID=UPI0003CC9655|nr:endo-1,4-beta-xylanase [Paenibacillus sp. JCM 10914]GAE05918.1 endo-1,4-beta-xylanase A precursor [Paenibacillus sp. JCM 10914]
MLEGYEQVDAPDTGDNIIPSLHEAFADCFPVGAAVSPEVLESAGPLIARHYNSLTAENHMKPIELQPEEGVYTFEKADLIANFARVHGMRLRGHTLVWHHQTPDWVFAGPDGQPAAREQLLSRMKAHIDTVVARYRGTVYGWDVVNEAIHDKGVELLRRSRWLELVGEDYIQKAFEFAHEADPDALLFYNDYHETVPAKREKIYTLVKSLLDRGTPIHGIGLQAHWNMYEPSLEDIRAAIERYASLGLKLQFTELDLPMFGSDDKRRDVKRPTEGMIEQQRLRYAQIFDLFRSYKDVISGVTFWGAADDYTWLDHFPGKERKTWPMLFNDAHEPKPCFWSVVEK